MKQLSATLILSTLLAGAASAPRAWCLDGVAVAGVVRDVHGTPLLGTLVQLLGHNALVLAQSVTDDHGRYKLSAGLPGDYQLRATGAFLVPETLPHLHLQAGAQAAADFTMMALFDVGTLFPAEKRTGGNASDDWRWTLRSIANRPLLRFVDDTITAAGGEVPSEISSFTDPGIGVRLTVEAGEGRFGSGGSRQEIAFRRNEPGDNVSVFKADLDDTVAAGNGGAYVLFAGLRKARAWSGDSRVVLSFAAHPDLRIANGSGVQVLRAATTERLLLGDEITIDAGTLLTMEQIAGGGYAAAPYVRVSFHPSSDLRVEYHMATDRALQRSEDLDDGSLSEEMISDKAGNPLLRNSLHQEMVAVQSEPNREISLAVYRDSVPFEAIQAEGALPIKDVAGLPVLVDSGTGTLRVAVKGYTAAGVSVSVSKAISPMLLARFDAQSGTALGGDGTVLRLNDLEAHLRPFKTAALSGTLTFHTEESGTVLRVHYRWQSGPRLTRVDEFDDESTAAFMGFDMRQRLCRGHRFHEVEAVLDASNVLGEGYTPALGPERQPLRLAQEARYFKGGLAFSF